MTDRARPRHAKDIGFANTVTLAWLDLAAHLRLTHADLPALRAALDERLRAHLAGVHFRRKTIDVLVSIWHKSAQDAPGLHAEALRLLEHVSPEARLWLHFGLALVRYPFFRSVAATVGQLGRLNEVLTRQQVKARLAAERGHLGALDRAVERICASLTEWGVLPPAERSAYYRPALRALRSDDLALQTWLLACALHAHPAETLGIDDLTRLPELFPFDLTRLRVGDLTRSGWFEVWREGGAFERVCLRREAAGEREVPAVAEG